MSLSIKISTMSRLKKNQNIDNLIQGIEVIAENQCSLSEQDRMILNEALSRLQILKRKKGGTNEQVLREVVIIVELLTKFFVQ